MSDAKQSKLPWTTKRVWDGGYQVFSGARIIAMLPSPADYADYSSLLPIDVKANAELFVQGANAHDGMLASMKTMRRKLADMSVYYWQDDQQALIVVADAAIYKTEKTE